jgi:hypothetical protein
MMYGLAGAVFAVDRLTKWIIETRVSFYDSHVVIPGFFRNRALAKPGCRFRAIFAIHVGVAVDFADRFLSGSSGGTSCNAVANLAPRSQDVHRAGPDSWGRFG